MLCNQGEGEGRLLRDQEIMGANFEQLLFKNPIRMLATAIAPDP
ncbi:MAG: hypothetical protein U0Q18_17420 [Bryobacteraceae bacterium]